ncbi:MAG: histidine kinase, partial [Solobacterium sp.]|nr:histidine kinase [Solobacterium sp.]
LLRSLSHDLRTPLTSIIGNTSNLISMGSSMEENDKQTIYEDIREDSFWLASQRENILSMSRLENNRYIQPSIENVEDVIQESLNHLDYRASEHTITFQRPEEALFAEMDSRLILQVLTNLINNAIKHTPAGSAITIRCTKEDCLIFISVADDGDGIPDGMKEHIFDLYYTGHRGLSETNRSMGIGLNLCAMILQAHGQKIEVLDNHPKGTIFRFSLKAKELQDERIQNTDC